MKALATAAAVLGLATAVAPAAAETPASNGGVTYEATPPGGARPGARKKPVRKRVKTTARPVLGEFRVSPRLLSPGATPSVTFRVEGRAAEIRVRLVVTWPGAAYPVRTVDLGRRAIGVRHMVDLPALADPALPEGPVDVRIAGRDTAGKVLRPGVHLSRVQQINVVGHVFPLRGTFSYGGEAARFGAPRRGHTHQGQDLMSDEGTPVVAVRAGTIDYVEYQPGGAGWYVVLDGEAEDQDYAYMHLKEGSIVVVKGQHVAAGDLLGGVGHTGAAQGDHLHFEIWQGAWYDGGKPLDPLPSLKLWQGWSEATLA